MCVPTFSHVCFCVSITFLITNRFPGTVTLAVYYLRKFLPNEVLPVSAFWFLYLLSKELNRPWVSNLWP